MSFSPFQDVCFVKHSLQQTLVMDVCAVITDAYAEMMLDSSTIIFSVIRLRSLNTIDFDDFAYTVVSVMTWTTAEVGVIIMVASSALLRPVFDKLFHRVLSLSGSRHQLGRSNPYANSHTAQSRMGSRLRKDNFVSVGDGTGASSHPFPSSSTTTTAPTTTQIQIHLPHHHRSKSLGTAEMASMMTTRTRGATAATTAASDVAARRMSMSIANGC